MMIKHFPEENSMVEGSIKDILNFKDNINLYVLITVRNTSTSIMGHLSAVLRNYVIFALKLVLLSDFIVTI